MNILNPKKVMKVSFRLFSFSRKRVDFFRINIVDVQGVCLYDDFYNLFFFANLVANFPARGMAVYVIWVFP